MKNAILIFALSFFIFSTTRAQSENKVPQVVKESFSNRYPNMQPDWQKVRNKYVAKFTENGKNSVVYYNKHGKLKARAWYVTYSELPQAAVLYLNKYYGGERNFDAQLKIENMDGILSYKAQMGSKEIVFDEKGTFIKKQHRRN